jgi:hypothetical protein
MGLFSREQKHFNPLRLIVIEREALAAFDLERQLSKAGHEVVATLAGIDGLSEGATDTRIDGIVSGPTIAATEEFALLHSIAQAVGVLLFAPGELLRGRYKAPTKLAI